MGRRFLHIQQRNLDGGDATFAARELCDPGKCLAYRWRRRACELALRLDTLLWNSGATIGGGISEPTPYVERGRSEELRIQAARVLLLSGRRKKQSCGKDRIRALQWPRIRRRELLARVYRQSTSGAVLFAETPTELHTTSMERQGPSAPCRDTQPSCE